MGPRMAGRPRAAVSRVSAIVAACGLAGLLLATGAAPAGASAESVSAAKYSCTNPVSGTQIFTAAIHADPSATSYKPGATTVSLTGFQVSLTIPASLISLAETFGVSSVTGQVTTFDLAGTNVTPTLRNVAKGFTVPSTKLPKPAKAITVKFPTAPVTIKGWKAGTKAGTMTFRTGAVVLSIGDNIGDLLTVTCAPSPVATIATSKVL